MRRAVPIAGIVLAAAALWGGLGSPPFAVGLLIWLAALWLPGAALPFPASVPSRGLDALWVPLATGPVCFGILVALGLWAGLPLGVSAMAAVLLGAAGLLVRAWRWSPPGARTAEGEASSSRLPLAIGCLVLLVAVLPPLVHAPLRWRDDAYLHLPIIERILAGSFPPENPFLAGTPLPYFWFEHVALAGVSRLSHLPLDLLFPLLSAQGLAVLLLALDRSGRRLGLSPLGRAAMLALIGAGFTPWGWMHLLYLRFTRPDVNWALFRAAGSSALFPVLNPFDPRLVASLTKVAISNALPMSLGLAAVALVPPRESGTRGWALRGIAAAGCLLFHVATGILLFAGLGLRWLLARVRVRPETADLARPAALVSFLVAGAATIPYLLLVLGARRGSGDVHLGWQGARGLGLEAALIGLLLLAIPALWAWRARFLPGLWLAAGIPALGLPFVAHLVDGNEYKAVFFLLPILALPAGAGLARLARGKIAAAALLLLPFLPTPYLAMRAYVEETPPGTLTSEERRLAREAAADLPPEAVLWKPQVGTGYYVLTTPLDHALFLSDPYALRILGQWEGEEARWRRASLELVRQGRFLDAVGSAQARMAPRPLYVVLTPTDLEAFPGLVGALRQAGSRVVTSNEVVAVLTVPALRPKP